MDLGLKGKVAMVAGASRGLGYAVAEALAREGALVSISSSNQASTTVPIASGPSLFAASSIDAWLLDEIDTSAPSRASASATA